jgi:putative transposase
MRRLNRFIKGEVYHLFNKSISRYGIFNDLENSHRFVNTFQHYNNSLISKSYYDFNKKNKFNYGNIIYPKENTYCKVLSYCIMPDHYHFLIKILKSDILSKLIGDLENSYTRYFNKKFDRRGPLWQNSFKVVKVRFDDQLLRVSRYIHLNPVVKCLVDKPENWIYSSYKDFITNKRILKNIEEINIKNMTDYKNYVKNNINYLKELKKIKKLILE